jgi:outer membrane immunogenic protein
MRKSLFFVAFLLALQANSASAADMPPQAPAVPYTSPTYGWTGFYAGVEAGGGWATEQIAHTTGAGAFPAGTVDNPVDPSGFLGGFYGGFNYQINQLVIGIDGDYEWASLIGSATNVSVVNGNIGHDNSSVSWIATVTGRIGYALNNWLLFAKGGGAWAGWSGNSSETTAAGAPANTGTASSNRDGWTAGGGIEYGLNSHVLIKLEYDYVGFSTASYNAHFITPAGAVSSLGRNASSSLNMGKLGLAYKF